MPDDNAPNLELMLCLMRAFGHEAEGKTGVVAGLEAAREGHFSVVLTDILMPEIDGYEFARRFQVQSVLPARPH
jgi:CheY-like chemotaxis protein